MTSIETVLQTNIVYSAILQDLAKRPESVRTPPAKVPNLAPGVTWDSLIEQTQREIQSAQENKFNVPIRQGIAAIHAGAITLARYRFWKDYSQIPPNDIATKTIRYGALLLKLDEIDRRITDVVNLNNNVVLKFFTDLGFYFITTTKEVVGIAGEVVTEVEKIPQQVPALVAEAENFLLYLGIGAASLLALVLLGNSKK